MNTPINPFVDVPDVPVLLFYDEQPEKNFGQSETLYSGVFPIYFGHGETQDPAEVNRSIVKELRKWNKAKDGDKLIITKGDLNGIEGGTNALKIIVIGQGLTP